MINTFNRRPLTIDVPNSKDVEHRYFNQYDWKGLIDSKNFLSVDQNSFSDCNNVYVNEEGLLRSRPSLKVKTISIVNGKEKLQLGDIVNVWNFTDTIVYESTYNNKYYLTFVNKLFENKNLQIELTYFTNNEYISYKECKLVVADRKIFVFSEHAFYYYDMDTNEYASAEKFIYVPVSKLYVNGIEQEQEPETKNILTSSEIYRYIYDNFTSLNFDEFIGQTVTLNINNTEYKFTFNKNTNLVFVDKFIGLSNRNFVTEDVVGKGVTNYPLISISKIGNILVSSYIIVDDGNKKIRKWEIYHSLDGIIMEALPNINENLLGIPKISEDGYYAIVFKNDGPYIYSLIATETNYSDSLIKKYNEWTSILKYYNSDLVLNLDTMPLTYDDKFVNTQINSYFITDDNFVFTYAKNTEVPNSSDLFVDFYIVYSLNGIIKEKCILGKNCEYNILSSDNDRNKSLTSILESETVLENGYTHCVYKFDDFLSNLELQDNKKGICNFTNIKIEYDKNFFTKINFVFSCKIEYVLDDFVLIDDIFTEKFNSNLNLYIPSLGIYGRVTSDVSNWSNDIPSISIDNSQYLIAYGGHKLNYIYNNKCMFGKCMPNIHCKFINDKEMNIGINLTYINDEFNYNNADIFVLINENNFSVKTLNKHLLNNINPIPALNNSIKVYDKYIASVANNNGTFIYKKLNINDFKDYEIVTLENIGDTVVLNTNLNYILSNKYLYSIDEKLSIPLLFEARPIEMYNLNLILCKNNIIYTSNAIKRLTLDIPKKGSNNYILPHIHAELQEHYFAKDKTLYISEPRLDGNKEFMWYLPELKKQDFNFNITNLHPISSTEMAIFMPNEIYYTLYDTDVSAYRYYKTKLQVGCKKGCDVITTFDGKYVIFTSERGLVAMSYQQFVATTEQSLDYLSDNIYSIFYNYLTEANSENKIKLFKHSYWIFVYKQDSKKGFLLDMRNLSWWPIETMYSNTKFVELENKVNLLSNKNLFKLNNTDVYYFDNDGKLKSRIKWHIKSQKLHLNALNYYKHIVNITLASVHDTEALKNSQHNIQNSNLKLQVNNYRKKIDGNIDSIDDWSVVHYNIDIVRTYVQRLNYSKVNEFQYMLSYDNQTSLNVPLSLSNITIKYKIGGQIR